ncbi:hypothetical protein TELCIR_07130 [Teladorsagia circumcincta]|uniref:Uncharacterized protein n=1 Tax=Teladorsagia circumcincta TaxID=45464 RepID=A0A2G9ULG1_TELCI|nr:hypothetical protein TELCIR_07130 [Teladorsagia circumcincta]
MVSSVPLIQVLHENVAFQKYLVFALCVWLCRGSSETDLLTALKAERIPLDAQVMSGPPLVEYLQKSQKFFKVATAPTKRDFQHRVMDLMFIDQNNNPVVDEAGDNGDDIPERVPVPMTLVGSSLATLRGRAMMLEFNGTIALRSFTSVTKQIAVSSSSSKPQEAMKYLFRFMLGSLVGSCDVG